MIIRLRLDSAISLLPCAASPHTSTVDHIMCCATCARAGWTRRHQRILFAIVRACRFHGIYASTTDINRQLGVTHDEGPDALIFNNTDSLALDISVAYQSPASFPQVTEKRSEQKISKYEELAKELHWKILPIIFTGQCNPALKTLDHFKRIVAGRPFAGLKRALLCSSVIACARGNADILGSARARFALVPSLVGSGLPPPVSSLRANTALSHARFPQSQTHQYPASSSTSLLASQISRLASSLHEDDDQVLDV